MSTETTRLINSLNLARQSRTDAAREQAIQQLETFRNMDGVTQELRSELLFTLADLHDKQGNYSRAFDDAQAGHALKQDSYDAAAFGRYIDALIAATSAPRMAKLPRATHGSRKPVFIVGMPRSGTTLAEQILSSHPQVYGAGELREIMEISGTRPELTQPVLDAAASAILPALTGSHPNMIM